MSVTLHSKLSIGLGQLADVFSDYYGTTIGEVRYCTDATQDCLELVYPKTLGSLTVDAVAQAQMDEVTEILLDAFGLSVEDVIDVSLVEHDPDAGGSPTVVIQLFLTKAGS